METQADQLTTHPTSNYPRRQTFFFFFFNSSRVLFFDKERHCYTIIWNSCEQNFIEKDYFMPKGHEAARKVQRKIKTM